MKLVMVWERRPPGLRPAPADALSRASYGVWSLSQSVRECSQCIL